MYWGSSWGSHEVFQPKMPYYAKMGACPMKNSGMTFTFIWNPQPCIHNSVGWTWSKVGGQHLLNMRLPQYLSHVLSWSYEVLYFTDNQLKEAVRQSSNLNLNDERCDCCFRAFVPPNSITVCSNQAIKESTCWSLLGLG